MAVRAGRSKARTVLALAATAAAALAVAAPAGAADGAGYRYYAQRTVDDPMLDKQWALAGGAGIDAHSAWNWTLGGSAIVAVVDTGVDLGHPDLAGNLWVNERELPGNGRDDDDNGYVDDVNGYDFANEDADPADDEGHGTHVAGTIAASGGNGMGVSGVAGRARIMALKALDRDASGRADDAARAIRYAVENGARAINASFNGPGESEVLREAIAQAGRAGVPVIASAGNEGQDIDAEPSYPASFKLENLVAVAATGRDGELTSFSNRGRRTVDVAAPGERILSTARGGNYEYRNGTSMAAPHVTGTMLLLASARPELSGTDLRQAVSRGARRALRLDGVAGGSLDAGAALAFTYGQPRPARPRAGKARASGRTRRAARPHRRARHRR